MSKQTVRVLVVDDVACVRKVIVAAIQIFFGDEVGVETVADLEQAMSFDPRSFDLVFTDLLLPGNRSGLELLYFWRRLNLNTPFVVMTGLTADQVFERLDSDTPIGRFEILTKPFRIVKIRDLICDLITTPALYD